MQKRTETLHQRACVLTMKLIQLEREASGGSLADALERLVLKGSQSPDADALIWEEVSKDPQMKTWLEIAGKANRLLAKNAEAESDTGNK